MAISNGHTSVAKLLLDRRCAVNAIESTGHIALHYACWNGPTKCVEELLTHGADATIKNKAGLTPLDFAQQVNDQAIIRLLTMEPKKGAEQHLLSSKKNTKKDTKKMKISSELKASTRTLCNELRSDMNQTVGALKRATLIARLEPSIFEMRNCVI